MVGWVQIWSASIGREDGPGLEQANKAVGPTPKATHVACPESTIKIVWGMNPAPAASREGSAFAAALQREMLFSVLGTEGLTNLMKHPTGLGSAV